MELTFPPQYHDLQDEWMRGPLGDAFRHDWDAGGLAWETGTNRVAMVGRVGTTQAAVEELLDGLGWDLVSIDYAAGHVTIVAAWR